MHTPRRDSKTRNPSKRAAADPRLRPRGHWEWALRKFGNGKSGEKILTARETSSCCGRLFLQEVLLALSAFELGDVMLNQDSGECPFVVQEEYRKWIC